MSHAGAPFRGTIGTKQLTAARLSLIWGPGLGCLQLNDKVFAERQAAEAEQKRQAAAQAQKQQAQAAGQTVANLHTDAAAGDRIKRHQAAEQETIKLGPKRRIVRAW